MNVEEYETIRRARYERLASVVELILKNTLEHLDGIANTPQTQKRAKDPDSLRRKLVDRGLEGSSEIEAHIKDLAGCRIIFYTNIDLERFRQASTWTNDFEVDWRASKTHFPRTEDASAEDLYQGIHYVVCLKPSRTSLVEYADLAGLRYEVQLQTILNHAWSATSHDVLYKGSTTQGFGAQQQEAIKKRFANVMRQHLMLAEYEMQKIQSDVERLRAGLAIFDEAPLQQLATAKDNNARYETLDKIKQHLLPGLDDVSAHLRDIRRAVIEAIEAARTAPIVDREGSLGGFKGATSQDVLRRGLEILDDLRYGYIDEAFEGLVRLWQGADADDRQKFDRSIERLAEYNLAVWKECHAEAQLVITEWLEALGADGRRNIRPVVLDVSRTVLQIEMRGSEATSYDTISFSRATVLMYDGLRRVRELAKSFTMEALREAATSREWERAWAPLWTGATASGVGEVGEELRKDQFSTMRQALRFVRDNASRVPFDVLQGIEESFYWAHRRLGKAEAKDTEEEAATRAALVECRDHINGNVQYVRYKTLVGFRTVFVEEWDNEMDVGDKEKERARRIEALAESVSAESRDEWFAIIKQCAQTDSEDIATFPPLTRFLKALSAKNPSITRELLQVEADALKNFIPSCIPALVGTDAREDTLRLVDHWIGAGWALAPLSRALLNCDEAFIDRIERIARRALPDRDLGTCFEIAHTALKHGDAANSLIADVYIPALEALTEAGHGWPASSYLSEELLPQLERLPEQAAQALLRNFVCCKDLGYGEQRKLSRLAKRHLGSVWQMFEARMQEVERRPGEDRYNAAPEHWHGVEKVLRGPDVGATFARVKAWQTDEAKRGHWEKIEFLAGLYHDCDEAFVEGISTLVKREGVKSCEFVCRVLLEFEGNFKIYPACQAMIEVVPADHTTRDRVRLVIEQAGVTSGEFGRAEAYEEKAKKLAEWLTHDDPKVVSFAAGVIDDFGKIALDERRRGTERRERRKRDFEGP